MISQKASHTSKTSMGNQISRVIGPLRIPTSSRGRTTSGQDRCDHADPRQRGRNDPAAQEEIREDRAADGEERRADHPARQLQQDRAEHARRRRVRRIGSGGRREPQPSQHRSPGRPRRSRPRPTRQTMASMARSGSSSRVIAYSVTASTRAQTQPISSSRKTTRACRTRAGRGSRASRRSPSPLAARPDRIMPREGGGDVDQEREPGDLGVRLARHLGSFRNRRGVLESSTRIGAVEFPR